MMKIYLIYKLSTLLFSWILSFNNKDRFVFKFVNNQNKTCVRKVAFFSSEFWYVEVIQELYDSY